MISDIYKCYTVIFKLLRYGDICHWTINGLWQYTWRINSILIGLPIFLVQILTLGAFKELHLTKVYRFTNLYYVELQYFQLVLDGNRSLAAILIIHKQENTITAVFDTLYFRDMINNRIMCISTKQYWPLKRKEIDSTVLFLAVWRYGFK